MKQIYLQSAFKGGYNRLMKYISNIAHMSEKDRAVIYHRLKILEFWERHGLSATKEAFGVSRSTLFGWQNKLKTGGGLLSSLKSDSKAPKTRSPRKVNLAITDFIVGYRLTHPGVGKEAITPELNAHCLALRIKPVSESTVGRLLVGLKQKGLIRTHEQVRINGKTGNLHVVKPRLGVKKTRRNGYVPLSPGDLVQVDAITVFTNGVRRYLITAIDVKTRFAFAYAYKSLTSANATDFMAKFQLVAPFVIKRAQTDNGAEFHKHFDAHLATEEIIHYWSYPRQPKSNAYIERFNRTIQEQHTSWHIDLLKDPKAYNLDLMQYLLWYNTTKPHKGINKQTPLGYYCHTFIEAEKSNMLWTLTLSIVSILVLLRYRVVKLDGKTTSSRDTIKVLDR